MKSINLLNYEGRFSKTVKGSDTTPPDEFLVFYKGFAELEGFAVSDIQSNSFRSKDGKEYVSFFFEVYKYGDIK